jgi:phage-related protein
MSDPKLIIKTLLDNSQLKPGLSDMNSMVSRASAKVGTFAKVGAAAVGTAVTAGTTAAAALVKKSVEGYATFEQMVGGVETLFGAGGQSMEEYAQSTGKTVGEIESKYNSLMTAQTTVLNNANNAYKTAGLSANDYMETVTSFSASLIQSLGGDTEKAASYADRAITDMSDNSNKMGTNMRDIQNAYQGFAKQNYTMLDNLKLGYGGTQEEMKRLIKDASQMTDVQQKLGVTVDESSLSFGNIVNAISVMQESLGIAGTTSKEAATTIEGSLNSAKAAWENLVVGMADDNADFDTLVQNFVDTASTAVENMLPRIEIALTGLGQLIEKLLPVIVQKVPEIIMQTLPGLINAGIQMVSALGQGLMQYLPELISYATQLVVQLVQGLVSALPKIVEFASRLIQTIVTSLVNAAPDLIDAGKELIEFLVNGIAENLPNIVQIITDLISNINSFWAENGPEFIKWGTDLLSNLIDGITQAVPVLLQNLPGIIQSMVEGLLNNGPVLIECGLKLLLQLIEGILSCIPDILAAIPQIIAAIVEAFVNYDWLGLGTEVINFVKDGMGESWDNIVAFFTETIPNFIQSIFDWFNELPGKLLEWGQNVYTTVTTAISDMVTAAVEFISELPDKIAYWIGFALGKVVEWGSNMREKGKAAAKGLFDSVVNGLANLPNKIMSTGKNIVSGLWKGIKGAWSGLTKKVSNLAGKLLQGFKDALGIHSPSRKFKWVGEMCVAGMDEPIADYNPYDTLNKSIKANASTMKANFVGSGSYAATYNAVYDYDAQAQATARALKGMSVNIDGKRAGKIIAPHVDAALGDFATVRT